MQASTLHIHIRVGSEDRVQLELPARSALWIETLMPFGVSDKIKAYGIDLDSIKRNLESKGLVPQELFRFQTDGKDYRVWLS